MQNGSGPGQGDGNGPDARADGPEARADGPEARADGPKARADGPEARADGPDARAWPDGQSGLVPLDGEGAPEQPDILDARLSPDGEGAPDDRDALVSPDAEGGPGLRASLEAIMLVADEPVSEIVIAQVLERPRAEVADALRDLAASYAAEQRGFELREVAGGWRFYTCEECAPVVERFVSDGQEVRLTQAALETLAVVAYRQPVSRARVSAVRGVNCDGVIRTLVLRGLVEEAGTDPETGAILFATTGYFLERLGLPGLDALPELAPFLPDHIDDEADASHEPAES